MKLFLPVLTLCILFSFTSESQDITIPDYYVYDRTLSDSLHLITERIGLDSVFDIGDYGTEVISLAVIDLRESPPRLGGVHMDNFIYPASVYKMYVAAEVLNQVSRGEYSLYELFIVESPNDVDRRASLPNDPRSVPRAGDTLTVNYLLDLMITTSSNTAANCLIDLATRERINQFMHNHGWHGSEVTRKFLSREFEDPDYKEIRGTETCALHAADFLYRIYSNRLINPWVSQQMMTLLGRQLDKSKLATGFPDHAMFYHKSGWWSYWTNDCGIVDNGETKFVIAAFIPLRQQEALPKFRRLGEEVFRLMESWK
jgi:beta-lactamase class A